MSRELLEREIGHGPRATVRSPRRRASEEFGGSRLPLIPARSRPRRDLPMSRGVRAERELVRTMLHRPSHVEFVAERLGPQEFHDPLLGAIYGRLAALGADRTIEQLAEGLTEEEGTLLEELLSQDTGLDDADRVVKDCLDTLQLQRLSNEMSDIDRQMGLAQGTEQDDLMQRKQQLSKESRALGGRTWKGFGKTSS